MTRLTTFPTTALPTSLVLATALCFALSLGSAGNTAAAQGDQPGVVLQGGEGPGDGKHIVFVIGDEEYRSEESMPQLAKILAKRHGFKCTLLFATNKETGLVDPMTLDNIPGLDALQDADLMVMFLRFRRLPEEQMQKILDYTNSGRPILALRTSTHAFKYPAKSPLAKWSWRSKDPKGGYGRAVLGETWIAHHGHHNVESTRALPSEGQADHPVLRGVGEIWGPSDVYKITTLSGDSKPILDGHVLTGMKPDDPINREKPTMPVAWTKTYTGTEGKTSTVFTTTMGHSGDLKDADFRRLLVNACYWLTGLDVPEKADVELVGTYDPLPIGYGKYRQGVRPEDHQLQ